MAKKNQQGGKRPGSGAKEKSDKKKPITIYVYQSVIDKEGIEALRKKLYAAV